MAKTNVKTKGLPKVKPTLKASKPYQRTTRAGAYLQKNVK